MKHMAVLVSGRHEKAQGHHPAAQEPEEAASCEHPHHGLDGAPARGPCLQLRSEKGTLHFGGHDRAGSQWELVYHNKTCVFPVGFRCGFSDCGDPGAVTVRVSRRDGHTHLWPELWVSH